MTTERQIAANRLNALRSTGPKSPEGKDTSRRNAWRHGLTAETIIGKFEDCESFAVLEAEVIAEFDPRTVTERALVARLTSLIWRLRRAGLAETGLLNIQADTICEQRAIRRAQQMTQTELSSILQIEPNSAATDIAHCFLRLSHVDNGMFERISRYEAILWRQLAQTLLILKGTR